MQKISSFHQFILETKQILESRDLWAHTYIWPPPKNLKLSWICINASKISLYGYTHFWPCSPQYFSWTFNFHESISASNKSVFLFCYRDIAGFKILQFDWLGAIWPISHEPLKYWVFIQRGQSYLMGRRCLFSLVMMSQ